MAVTIFRLYVYQSLLKKKLFEITFFYRLSIVYNTIDDEMNAIQNTSIPTALALFTIVVVVNQNALHFRLLLNTNINSEM